MTAFVAASDTASWMSPTPSSFIPARPANAATSRRIAPTPDGVEGYVASNDTGTASGYPAPGPRYLLGLPDVLGWRDGRRGEAARRDERSDVPQGQRGDGGRAGPRRPAHLPVRVRA